MQEFIPNNLPYDQDLETKDILKQSILANKALAELKGVSGTIPNQAILINALSLQEAKDSSEIENIITTHDELYQALITQDHIPAQTKEVQSYSDALYYGFDKVLENKLLLTKDIIKMQQIIKQNDAGVRKQSGTVLSNQQTGEVTYIPPQDEKTINELLTNLERYINDATLQEIDPLIKMAIIHYQFESIHPFYDGNGRAGRIINILYLVLNDLLDLPILYLSKYIIRTKSTYYRLLEEVRTKDALEEWVMYILKGIEETAKEEIKLIQNIKILMDDTKNKIRTELPQIYSKDLLETLFVHPYTKIAFLEDTLGIHRTTASNYLKQLENIGILEGKKLGRSLYCINTKLYKLFKEG